MLELLLRLSDARLAGCFIEPVVVESYESGINKELTACLMLPEIAEALVLLSKHPETYPPDDLIVLALKEMKIT